MKTKQLRTSKFESNFKSSLIDLDIERKKTANKVLLLLGPFSLLAFGILLFLSYQWSILILGEFRTSQQDYMILLAGFVGWIFIATPFVWGCFSRKKRVYRKYLYGGEYLKNYKKEVITKLIQQLDEPLMYQHEIGIPEKLFRASGFPLFANPATFFSYDSIAGEIGKTNIQFGEVLAEQYIENKGSKHYCDLFRGMFFVADLHKVTDWNTIVYPDTMKYFSKLLVGKYSDEKAFSQKKYERIKLEDPEFEKYFEVYGTNQVESRYLLSTALMARLVDFKRKTKKDIQISFQNNSVYFSIYYSQRKPLFRPPLFTTAYNLKNVENYISDLELMIDVVKELNVNAKIT